jgi:recombination associated protein RdgC
MWFKNINIFKVKIPSFSTAAELHQQLAQHQARSCGQLERSTVGWASPLGEDYPELVYQTQQCFFLAAKQYERLLPTTVLREHTAERVKDMEQEQQRKLGTREKRAIFDQVMVQLLPKAFIKSSITYAYIDLTNNWLIIDTSSQQKAENFVILLRNSLPDLQLEPIAVQYSISQIMTDWLLEQKMPHGLLIEDYCEMHDPRAVHTQIKCVNQDLYTEEVQAHLKTGKQVTRLGLTWEDRLTFVMSQEFSVKRIKPLDLVQQQMDEMDIETTEQRLIADCMMMAGEFSELLKTLLMAFGGSLDDTAQSSLHREAVFAD